MDEAEQRDILRDRCQVLAVLLRQTDVPLLILAEDIVGTRYEHRRHQHDRSPQEQRRHEAPLVLREEEES